MRENAMRMLVCGAAVVALSLVSAAAFAADDNTSGDTMAGHEGVPQDPGREPLEPQMDNWKEFVVGPEWTDRQINPHWFEPRRHLTPQFRSNQGKGTPNRYHDAAPSYQEEHELDCEGIPHDHSVDHKTRYEYGHPDAARRQ